MTGQSATALRVLAGLALAWGLVLSVGATVTHTPLEAVDERVFEAVNGLGPAPDVLWAALDPHTRNYAIVFVVTVLAAVASSPATAPRIAVLSLVSALTAWGLLEATYAVLQRPRPEEELAASAIVLDGHSWAAIPSFPSGHMAITGALCTVIAINFRRLRWPALGYLAAVGATRVLFGAHFPIDVMAGTALGVASAIAVTRLAALPARDRLPSTVRS